MAARFAACPSLTRMYDLCRHCGAPSWIVNFQFRLLKHHILSCLLHGCAMVFAIDLTFAIAQYPLDLNRASASSI